MIRIQCVALLVVSLPLFGCPDAAPPPAEPKAAPVEAKPSYTVLATVADAAKVIGTVRYAGTRTDGVDTIDRDEATCGGAGKGPSGALIVNDGLVKNAVLEVTEISEGLGTTPTTVRVDNVGCVFEPRVALAHVGDTFVSHNSDPVFHNAKLELVANNKRKRIANLPVPLQNTDSPSRVLKRPGVVEVSCDAHLWMRSTLYVTEHPYTAITDAKGRAVIADLPPGKRYGLKVWHEVLGEKTVPFTVEPKGETAIEIVFEE